MLLLYANGMQIFRIFAYTPNPLTMSSSVFISLYLDTRRSKANGKFPVKLRIFTNTPRIQKLYPTKFALSRSEFQSIWETKRTREEYKDIKREMQSVEQKANQIAGKLSPFTFELFEKKFVRKATDAHNVVWYYQNTIKKLHGEKCFGTASNYEVSLKSLLGFQSFKKGRDIDYLDFHEIDAKWLLKYEQYMTGEKKLSLTTVGIYLRPLRAIFNTAIAEGDIEREVYPFGKRKYQIPSPKSVKKALNMQQIRKLFYAKAHNAEQEKAKAFWFFSFACNGMNIKDIALLRYENIDGNRLSFYRAKTRNTTKSDLKLVEAYLTKKPKAVIKKYGNKNTGPKQFVFPILSESQTDLEQFWAIKNFTKFINQHVKNLAESVGITVDISSYWARHSFATNAVRMGKSMEFVSEALSHGDVNTTKAYFAGFEDDDKKDFMEKLMNF